jgi:Ca2+-binding RTX toxin-like protein
VKKLVLIGALVALHSFTFGAVTTVSLSNGVLTIVADDAADTIQFQQWGGTTGQPLTYNTRVGVNPSVGNYDLLRTWSGQNGVPVNTGTITGVRKVVIKGGGGDDNISVNNTTPAGTVIELFGEAGNDTLTGGNNTKDLLVGGAGNDTLNGGNGNDTLYGDDVPTQTFSPADPFTVPGTATTGFGSPWVNIPGPFFNQRQVARFNQGSSASVANGVWTASLPNASSSSTALTYRQDGSYLPKDLSGIASMSFDITVQGSVKGYWYLLDPNGYILEVPQGFALSAGTHTVTLDFSTAAIDAGFDLSTIREMRIGMTAASANSSVSVSNLRYGVIAPTLVTTDADPFTTTATPGPANAVWTPISDSLFAQRRLQRFNQATTSLSGGFWDFTLQGTNATSYSYLHYRMDGSGGTTNLSGVSSMSVDFSNVTGSTTFSWYFVDINGNNAYQPVNYSVTSAGTVTFNMSTAQSDSPGFDWSQVVSMHLDMSRTTGANTSASARVSNFDATSGAAETGGNDILNGGGGSDFLFGQAGDDTINWGTGPDDVATGGSGNDIFIQDNNFAYQTLFGTITDFKKGTDKIRIKAAVVGLNAVTASLVYGTTHQSNRIVVDTTSVPGTTTLRLPVGGTGQIFLRGTHTDLTINDFVLF